MKFIVLKGTTNFTSLIFIQDSSSTTGAGLTGVVAANMTAFHARVEDDNDVVIAEITLSDLSGTAAVHADGGLEEISPNMPGWYRLDLPDAMFATGARSVGLSLIDAGANDIAQITAEFQLVDVDLEATDFGLSLDNTNLAHVDANERVDVGAWLGTAVTLSTGNKPDVNVDEWADVLLATTNPLPNAVPGAAGGVFIAGTNAATTVTTSFTTTFTGNLTGSVASVTGAVGSVTGAVGSVAGNVDGNVTGSVGSLVGHTVQTGDSFTRIGAAGASLTDLGGMSTGMKAEVQVEANDALVANNLDQLVFNAVTLSFDDTVDIDSVIGRLAQDGTGTGTGGGGFNRETDSLEAIRDNQQTAVDAAIDTVISELGVAQPTATPTLRTGLMLLYMMARNQFITQTSGTDAIEVHNDAGTKIASKALTDDGSDYTEAKMISG